MATRDPQGYMYRGPRAKRLTAEQFVDAVWQLTGSRARSFRRSRYRGSRGTQMRSRRIAGPGTAAPAQWIWGTQRPTEKPPAAGETIAFRKRPCWSIGRRQTAGAVITCDNEYALYVNRPAACQRRAIGPASSRALTEQLKVGENTISGHRQERRRRNRMPRACYSKQGCDARTDTCRLPLRTNPGRPCAMIPPQVKSGKGPLESPDWQPIHVLELRRDVEQDDRSPGFGEDWPKRRSASDRWSGLRC